LVDVLRLCNQAKHDAVAISIAVASKAGDGSGQYGRPVDTQALGRWFRADQWEDRISDHMNRSCWGPLSTYTGEGDVRKLSGPGIVAVGAVNALAMQNRQQVHQTTLLQREVAFVNNALASTSNPFSGLALAAHKFGNLCRVVHGPNISHYVFSEGVAVVTTVGDVALTHIDAGKRPKYSGGLPCAVLTDAQREGGFAAVGDLLLHTAVLVDAQQYAAMFVWLMNSLAVNLGRTVSEKCTIDDLAIKCKPLRMALGMLHVPGGAACVNLADVVDGVMTTIKTCAEWMHATTNARAWLQRLNRLVYVEGGRTHNWLAAGRSIPQLVGGDSVYGLFRGMRRVPYIPFSASEKLRLGELYSDGTNMQGHTCIDDSSSWRIETLPLGAVRAASRLAIAHMCGKMSLHYDVCVTPVGTGLWMSIFEICQRLGVRRRRPVTAPPLKDKGMRVWHGVVALKENLQSISENHALRRQRMRKREVSQSVPYQSEAGYLEGKPTGPSASSRQDKVSANDAYNTSVPPSPWFMSTPARSRDEWCGDPGLGQLSELEEDEEVLQVDSCDTETMTWAGASKSRLALFGVRGR
jgi:hypothetical protein